MPDWLDKQMINTIILFLIVLWLSYERRKLKETLTYHLSAIRQLVLAVREDAETTPEGQGAAVGPEHWETIRKTWAEARERIEIAIEELDGRVRKKYGQMARYSYADIIVQLQADKKLSANAANALVEMNRIFLGLRRRTQQTSRQDADGFGNLYQRATPELPRPDEEPDA
jgi:hypothetical protein